jgi:hypothetical protein
MEYAHEAYICCETNKNRFIKLIKETAYMMKHVKHHIIHFSVDKKEDFSDEKSSLISLHAI